MDRNDSAFNLKHAAILALGSSVKCRNSIEEIYKTDELNFYNTYKLSPMYNDKVKEIYPAIDLEHINMLIGIFENAYRRCDFNSIYTIAKVLNPRILKFLKNKTIVNIDEFLENEFFRSKYRKRVGNGIFFDESINEGERFKEATVLFYLASLNRQSVEGLYKNRIIGNYYKLVNSLLIHKMAEKPTACDLVKMNELKQSLGLSDDFINRQNNLGDLFDNLIEYQVEAELCRKIGTDTFKKLGVTPSLYDATRTSVFKSGLFKYIGTFTKFTPLLNFETDLSMASIPISQELIDKFIFTCVNAQKENHIPEQEMGLLLTSMLYMYAIIHHYNELKEKYLYSEKEKYFDDITNLKENLNNQLDLLLAKENEIDDIIKKNTSELKELKEKLATATSDLRTMGHEMCKKEDELKKVKDENESLNAKNEMLYELLQMNFENPPSQIPYAEKLHFIQSKKIAFFGGNKTTIHQLKNQFEKLIVFEKNTSDISSIISCDAVFVNYQWLKHSLSYKLYSLAKTEKIPFVYISGTNIEKIVTQMYDILSIDNAEAKKLKPKKNSTIHCAIIINYGQEYSLRV